MDQQKEAQPYMTELSAAFAQQLLFGQTCEEGTKLKEYDRLVVQPIRSFESFWKKAASCQPIHSNVVSSDVSHMLMVLSKTLN